MLLLDTEACSEFTQEFILDLAHLLFCRELRVCEYLPAYKSAHAGLRQHKQSTGPYKNLSLKIKTKFWSLINLNFDIVSDFDIRASNFLDLAGLRQIRYTLGDCGYSCPPLCKCFLPPLGLPDNQA